MQGYSDLALTRVCRGWSSGHVEVPMEFGGSRVFCHGEQNRVFPNMLIMGKPTRWKRLLSTTLTKAWWHHTASLILCVVFQHSSLRKHHHTWASCPTGKGRHPTSISCCIPNGVWKKTAQGGEDLSERGLPPSCFQIRTPLKAEGCHSCCRYKCWKVSSFSSTSYALPGATPGAD